MADRYGGLFMPLCLLVIA